MLIIYGFRRDKMFLNEAVKASWIIVCYICTCSVGGVMVNNVSVQGGQVHIKGSTIQIIASVSDFTTGAVDIYKTDSSSTPPVGTAINTCDKSICFDSTLGRYSFTPDLYHINITIQDLNRMDDQKWWHYRGNSYYKNIKSTFINVYTLPTSLVFSSVPSGSQDLSDTDVTLTCRTGCIYPAVQIAWLYTYGNNARQPFTLSKTTSSSTTQGCTEMEIIVSSTLTLVRYTVFPDNSDATVKFECGITTTEAPRYTPVYSNKSQYVTFAVKAGKPTLLNKTNVALLSGDPVQFVCKTTATRPSANVTWMLGTILLTNTSDTVREISHGLKILTSTVTFTPHQTDHQKTVRCDTGIPEQTERPFDSAPITIWWPPVNPVVSTMTQPFPWLAGQTNNSLHCSSNDQGNPPSRAEWTSLSVFLQRNGDLVFPTLKPEHNNQSVKCKLVNSYTERKGVTVESQKMHLNVEFTPKIIAEDTFVGQPKSQTTIPIRFYSHPSYTGYSIIRSDDVEFTNLDRVSINVDKAHIHTHFHNTEVRVSGFLFQLEINNLTEADFSSYTLSLMNTVGRLEWDFVLIPQSVPHIPLVFLCIKNTNPPTLYWEPGFNGGYKQTFIIGIFKNHHQAKTFEITEDDYDYRLPNETFIATVTGLSTGIYTARIWAENKLGQSIAMELDEYFIIPENQKDEHSSDNGVIVGAATGGGASLVIIAVVIVVYLQRRHSYSGDHAEEVEGQTEDISNIYESLDQTNTNPSTYETITATADSSVEQSNNVYENLQID